jgi:hypothetical protein
MKVQYIYRRNTKVKPHWTMNTHVSNGGKECKTGHVKGRVIARGEG